MNDCLETDVLIIGNGIAGSTAALHLADNGLSVVVVTRSDVPEETNTFYAQGGIIYQGQEDSAKLLKEDIIRAGAGHCYPEAVDILSRDGPALVRDILMDRVGIAFDRDQNNDLSLFCEGSHSTSRILHATDVTGEVIQRGFIRALVDHPNITLFTNHTAVDLLSPNHHSIDRLSVYKPLCCIGAYLLDQQNNRVVRCLAKKTILATGGLGQIYLRTTNPPGARGDGIAMAYRLGARVINNEFIQFHPTAFFYRHAPLFLISEAVRGAGARLVHADGRPFMQEYDPEWKDLAPRDVVSRSMHQEMFHKDVANVYLDFKSYIAEDVIKSSFPNIYKKCLHYGLDATKDLIPVVPAAHYACGGVWVDKWGRTTIKDLYAVGEVACTGVHGANRLASTSLLESLVWGNRSGRHIIKVIGKMSAPDVSSIPPWEDAGEDQPDPALIAQDMSSIKHIMWNYVGLIRNIRRLKRALAALRNLENEIERFYRVARVTDSLIGLRNAVRTAVIITSAAWENKRSMGCHYRED